MADQGNTEQVILPDDDQGDAGGAGERDEGIEDISKVGIGSDINSGDEEPEVPPSEQDEGSEGTSPIALA